MFRGHNIPRVLMFNRIFIRIYKNLNQDSRAVGMTDNKKVDLIERVAV